MTNLTDYEPSTPNSTDAHVVSVKTLDEAEVIRKKLMRSKHKIIVYVMKNKMLTGYHIYISNEIGGVPSKELYKAVRGDVGLVKDFEPQEIKTLE